MGITFLTFSGLFAPLQQFAGWLGAATWRVPPCQRPARVAHAPALNCASGRAHFAWPPATRAGALPLRRPLRVVRVLDACHAPASAGRMVISGRMADVCAELERLAAVEADQAG